MTTREPAGVAYEVCTSLISALNRQLDRCSETTDPWEARYKFDAIIPFVNLMEEQVGQLEDDAERDTCAAQLDQVVERGRTLAPSIPLICARCGDAYGPEARASKRDSEEETAEGADQGADDQEICRSCRTEREKPP